MQNEPSSSQSSGQARKLITLASTAWLIASGTMLATLSPGLAAHLSLDLALVIALGIAVPMALRKPKPTAGDEGLELALHLARAAERHEGRSGKHHQRIGFIARAVANRMGLSDERCTEIGQAAMLHDVGKIWVDQDVIRKPGRLTEEEREEMSRHVEHGAALLQESSNPIVRLGGLIARTHHERWDGTGYPAGLMGESIPLEGRIVAACDVLDALTSDRPYRPAMSLEQALDVIELGRGSRFDPKVVDALQACRTLLSETYVESTTRRISV